jgi:integrase
MMHVRSSTRVRVQGIYKSHVIPEFGHLPLTALSPVLVQGWVGKMMLNMSAASVRKNTFVLRKVCDLAVSHGLIRSNPVVGVRLPAESKREQRFLTHTEAWALAEAIVPRFKAMVLVAVFGGLRAGEIAALRRSSINPERNTITVKETVVDVKGVVSFGPPKTKTSVRTVTIPRSIMGELVAHMEAYTGESAESLVFTGERGVVVRRSWFYRYYWSPATAKAGLSGLRFHDLRHTFVALWIHAGRNAKEVSRAAGHSSVAFTLDRYGHLYDTDSDSLADELDTLLGHIRPHEVTRTVSDTLAAHRPPSSSGLGRRPFTASTGSDARTSPRTSAAPSSPSNPSVGKELGHSRTHE